MPEAWRNARVFRSLPLAFVGIAMGALMSLSAIADQDPLMRGFVAPPDAAKPRVWWHWLDGNVTKRGIGLDLAWMHRVGVGGMDAIFGSMNTPQVVNHRIAYLSPEWKEAVSYSAALARKYGLEMAIDTSPGWSLTGGPWVKPEQAMKKLVWSETVIQGGTHYAGELPMPPQTTGPFQNVGYVPRDAGAEAGRILPQFYKDSAVIAYRVPVGAPSLPEAKVTSSAGQINAALLSDGDLVNAVSLPAVNGAAWVQFSYENPQTIQSAVLGTPLPLDAVYGNLKLPILVARLDARINGAWQTITTLSITNVPEATVSFPAVTASEFRFSLTHPTPIIPDLPPWIDKSILAPFLAPPKSLAVSELSLSASGRVNEFERKAGFGIVDDYYAIDTPTQMATAAIAREDVIDLSPNMRPDGWLQWDPPPGQWRVLRFGYSLLGIANTPAPLKAMGLEVDKLDHRYVRSYLDTYLESFTSFLAPSLVGSHGLQALLADSTEVGPQNWTDDLIDQFRRLRSYDPRPWLPVLTGVVIGSARDSDKFLWDFRRTLAELLATEHYAELAMAAHSRGLRLYGEAIENKRQAFGDDMEMRRYTDVPTAAMWTFPVHEDAFSPYLDKGPQPTFIGDIRGAASVAHLYGQNLAAAESLTACGFVPWAFGPRDLKPVADLEFALGINRILIHTSAHQPNDKAPGLTLGPCGQFFDRLDTWAEQAGPWVSYLARSSYMLQQGRSVADVAYFYGEEAPLTILQEEGRLDDAPSSVGFDFVNADAILNLLDVRDGVLSAPSGARFRILQLGGASQRITVPVLRKLKAFVEQGLVVYGARPTDTPSFADDEAEFQKLRSELWGPEGAGASIGHGRVIASGSIEEALRQIGVMPDVSFTRAQTDSTVMFAHRKLDQGDVYFLTNRKDRAEVTDVSLRTAGYAPEIWRAESGKTEAVTYRIEAGRTIVSLHLQPYESIFIVCRKPTTRQSASVSAPRIETVATLVGPWSIAFQPNRGAPASVSLAKLESWTASSIPGVKYFSGSGTYAHELNAPSTWFAPGLHLQLDLGMVDEMAQVSVNGKVLGVLWNAPYRVDVTEALRPGDNRIEIKVTNLWVNRLVGDKQPGAVPIAFTTNPASYTQSAPLKNSGLLGPVLLQAYSVKR